MEANEIMVNEEVVEATEEIVEASDSCKGLKVAAGVGAAVLCGWLVYRCVAKPMIAKLKAKKNTDETVADAKAEPEENDDGEEESTED